MVSTIFIEFCYVKKTSMKLLSMIAILAATAFTNPTANPSIHSFKINAIDGKTMDLSKYKGKKILIVNVASQCGYTKQYDGLQKLYEANKDKLVIIGFPCNQFGGQEPGGAEEIQQFCKKNFGVTFPLTEKIDVKGGNQAAIYKWLTSKSENGVLDATITWNFNKFLIDEKGELLAYFPSKVAPDSEEIAKYLK
jgi:glutathione peroxidase